MDQGVIATLKALYRKITFSKAHETHETLVDFYQDFTVYDAVMNFGEAWSQITQKNMSGVWKPLLQRENEADIEPIGEIIEEIVNLGNDLDFKLSADNVKECLEFDEKDLSNEDLIDINQPKAFEAKDDEECS